MHFLIGKKYNVLFGWNAKCGCTHIKKIRNYLEDDKRDTHKDYEDNNLPENIDDYTIILVIRNPYKRIVSGFLDKYRENGEFRNRWLNKKPVTFVNFVDELVKGTYKVIDEHHFIPQLSKAFDMKRLKNHNNLVIFDIENINYNYIETLFNKKIPKKFTIHWEGDVDLKNKEIITYPVYNLLQKEYANYKPTTDCFYNKDIKDKVYNFYRDDFKYFKEKGFDYDIYDFCWKKM